MKMDHQSLGKTAHLIACFVALVVGRNVARPQSPDPPPEIPAATGINAATNAASTDPEAEAAWKEFLRAAIPPPLPAEWGGKPPTEEQQKAFMALQGQMAAEASQKAKAFFTRFP